MPSVTDSPHQEEQQPSPTVVLQSQIKSKATDNEVPPPSEEITAGKATTNSSTSSKTEHNNTSQSNNEQKIETQNSEVATEYHLKAIEWIDPSTGKVKQLKVITQNENGPCPLLALCNVLILRGDIEIRPYDRPSVTYELLVEILGDYLLRTIPHGETENQGAINNGSQIQEETKKQDRENLKPKPFSSPVMQPSVQDYRHTLNTALSIIPCLQTGLDVNVRFNSIHGFEPTEELSVFDVFRVDLVHGWVVDPQDADTWDVVVGKCGSYNRAVECVVRGDDVGKGVVVESLNGAGVGSGSEGALNAEDGNKVQEALMVSQFLDSTATQLTYYGLMTLAEALPSGHLCVLFRNNHFSTLYKHPVTSILYVLVTDAGFVNERSVVWESLTDVDQSASEFFNAQFKKGEVAGGDYVGVQEEHRHDSYGGSDRDYALALSLQQQEEEREAQYRRQHQQILQAEQQNQRRARQAHLAQQGQLDSESQSSTGSSFTTASSAERERRKDKKGNSDCIIT